ncbi:MAG: hypothetical protein ACK5SZ_01190, partial [bacterium]
MLIGFPGAEFTLAASRTDVAPAHWIAEGAIGIDSIIGPADSRRAMLKVEHFDPTGEHRIRADTYTNIPETMPGVEGVNYRAARSRFLRGIVVERIDEQGTIDETTIDDFGRVMSCSRTTVGSGRPPFTLAAITYDNGEIAGNDDITAFVRFGGSSPDRITSIARDWRGRVVSVSNPTAPHEVYSYDNLNRVIAVGLYGGAAAPLGASNPYAANSLRRALVATAFDQSGAIYKTSEYEINQHTGDVITIEGQAQALVTDRWHSPDGWLVAWTGTSDGRKRFNRIGEVTDEFVTVEAESMSYEVANAEPMPAGVITHRRLIRDPMTGDILAEILAEKSAATPVGMVWNPCAPNAWPLIPPSFMSGQFGSNINICNDANAGGFSHPMQVNSFVYDPLGRVIQKTKWGDPAVSRARGGDGCIPFGGTSAPIDGASIQAIGSFPDLENTDELSRWDDVYPRTESLARNRFGLPSVVAGASGRATVIEY